MGLGASHPEFFINPRCPLGAVLVEVVVALEAVTSEAAEISSATGAEVGDNLDSLSKVAGEREEPGVTPQKYPRNFIIFLLYILGMN